MPPVRSPFDRQELEGLLHALCEQQLTEEQQTRLEELLTGNDEAQWQYIHYLDLHANSLWTFGDITPDLQADVTQQAPTASAVIIEVEPASLSRRRKQFDSIHWQLHKFRFSTFSAVMTALAWVGFSFFVWFSTTPDDTRPESGGVNVNFVARVTGQYEHRWAEGMHGMPTNAFLVPGERLNLVEGFIEITFFDGAVVVLEGPSEFVVNSPGAGTLEAGKLSAEVPPEAVGFVVDTPLAQVVDRGTQFTVVVDKNETTVGVHEGRVTVQYGQEPPVELAAGRSWQCERDEQPRFIEFVAIAPLVLPEHHAPIYLDLGGGNPVASSAIWNVLDDHVTGSVADLRGANGDFTGIGVSVTDSFKSQSENEGGQWSNRPVAWAENAATGDYFAVWDDNRMGEITFTGLTGASYDFSIIVTRDLPLDHTSVLDGLYTIHGVEADNHSGVFNARDDGWIDRKIQTWTNVAPDIHGEIVLTVVAPVGTSSTYLNAVKIEAVSESLDSATVPAEPADSGDDPPRRVVEGALHEINALDEINLEGLEEEAADSELSDPSLAPTVTGDRL